MLSDIDDEIFAGKVTNGTANGTLLYALDSVAQDDLDALEVASWTTDGQTTSHTWDNLTQGVYYVRAVDFPANVNSVTNSVFALPYYEAGEGWIYTIDDIELAAKTDESTLSIEKTITNSTKQNIDQYTDVSLGDTVSFELTSSVVGRRDTSTPKQESKDMYINDYVVNDTMSDGFTLINNSVVVSLLNGEGEVVDTLTTPDEYTLTIDDNDISVELTEDYLHGTEFYAASKIAIDYDATLDKDSVRGTSDNNNMAQLVYANKNDVVSEPVYSNLVYAYTFGIEVNKTDDANTPLAGSTFKIYATQADAEADTNAFAVGTSDQNGKVVFYSQENAQDVETRLASGNWYMKETESTQDYNRYTDVITVPINVSYLSTFDSTNSTWIDSMPQNGIVQVSVKNSSVILPNTGSTGVMFMYIAAGLFLLLTIAFVIMKKRNNAKVVD